MAGGELIGRLDVAELRRLVETGSPEELEAFIQKAGSMIAGIRAMAREAHRALDIRNAERRYRIVKSRSADFPPAQGIGGPAPAEFERSIDENGK